MKYWEKPFGKDKPKTVTGEIHILEDRCKGCNFCIEYCPREVLEESKKFNKKGYHPPVVKEIEQCTFCGLCEIICPDFAIFVTENKETKDDPKSKHLSHKKEAGSDDFSNKEVKIV